MKMFDKGLAKARSDHRRQSVDDATRLNWSRSANYHSGKEKKTKKEKKKRKNKLKEEKQENRENQPDTKPLACCQIFERGSPSKKWSRSYLELRGGESRKRLLG